jgi:hypothetical protein
VKKQEGFICRVREGRGEKQRGFLNTQTSKRFAGFLCADLASYVSNDEAFGREL